MILMPDLFSFAYVPNWYSQLDMLAEMALPEPWRFKNPIYLTKNPDTPILERYIHAIFKKQLIDYKDERNPSSAADYFHIENEFCCFHTGLYGKSPSAIATYLTDEGIPTPGGKKVWRAKVVESILTNEKYKGDALLQKKFTVDFLTKKQKVNEGEVPQYYVTNSHPAIIEPELFDLVQYELKTRKTDGRFTSCLHPFSGRIICGECGGIYGSKVWHSNTENRSLVWQCNEKYRGQHCSTPHLAEGEIKAAFLAAFNIVLGNRDEIMEAYEEVIAALTDTADLDAEQETLENESEVVLGLIQKIISENAQTAMDQEEYNRRYDAYSERFEAARKRLAEIAELRQERNAKKTRIRLFMENMNNHQELVQSFDEELWYSTVDYVTVYEDKRLVFTFRDGRQVEITAELWRAA